jgi:hypothetical protein
MLRAGLDAEFIISKCNVSRALVKEWEEEFLKELLENGSGQRARIRDMLLRNSPQMINTLYKLAMQDVDTKLQISAATTFLGFASRFLKEDAAITAAEARIGEKSENFQATLFDFTLPGESKQTSVFGGLQNSSVAVGDEEISPEDLLDMPLNDLEHDMESNADYTEDDSATQDNDEI